jgi:hypothetical protein
VFWRLPIASTAVIGSAREVQAWSAGMVAMAASYARSSRSSLSSAASGGIAKTAAKVSLSPGKLE